MRFVAVDRTAGRRPKGLSEGWSRVIRAGWLVCALLVVPLLAHPAGAAPLAPFTALPRTTYSVAPEARVTLVAQRAARQKVRRNVANAARASQGAHPHRKKKGRGPPRDHGGQHPGGQHQDQPGHDNGSGGTPGQSGEDNTAGSPHQGSGKGLPGRGTVVVIRSPDLPDGPCRGGRNADRSCRCGKFGAKHPRALILGECRNVAAGPPPGSSRPSGTDRIPIAVSPELLPTAEIPGSSQSGSSRTRRDSPAPQDAAGTATGPPEAVPGEVLVSFDANAPAGAGAAVASRFGLVALESTSISLTGTRVVRFGIPDRSSIADVVAAMRSDPSLPPSQPNYLYRPQADPAAASTSSVQYALARLNAAEAHRMANGRGIRIAVIDTGIDQSHPDLAGAVAESVDLSGSGAPARSDHGTAVAGAIGARGSLIGIAPQADLLDVGAFKEAGSDRDVVSTSLLLLRALDWAVAHGARVINMSLTGPEDPLVGGAVEAAYARRVIIVAAAGNGGPEASAAYPAAYPAVIAVTATDAEDRLYPSANRGSYIAIAAPGVDVLTPVQGGSYRLQSGTSIAAAHVSGIIALELERQPSLGADEARRALAATATDLGPAGTDDQFGAGLANALAVLLRGPLAQGSAP